MRFNFNEKSKIYSIVEDGDVNGLTINKAIWNAAIYYTQLNPVDKKDVFWKIVEFMNENYNDFMYQGYVSIINRDINKAYKYKIKDVSVTKGIKGLLKFNYCEDNKITTILLHKIIYDTFSKEKSKHGEICFIDGNNNNCSFDNLITVSELLNYYKQNNNINKSVG